MEDNINHPCNAFNVQMDAHDAYGRLVWGIEAVLDGNEVNTLPNRKYRSLMLLQWKYLFREVCSGEVPSTIKLAEGQEIQFHCGDSMGKSIDKPNPEYCNIKLAIAHAMQACGVSDIIAEIYGDDDGDEEIIDQPVYMGGPFVSDDILFRRLNDRLVSLHYSHNIDYE